MARWGYTTDTDGAWGRCGLFGTGPSIMAKSSCGRSTSAFATTYYARNSGVGLAIQNLQLLGPMNVG